jgi:sec-independent protein translocase protein TatB
MFDVGFSELIVIAIVALVVIGPERLPKVARTAGLLLGRLQRYVNDVKADINREMQLDELKALRSVLHDSARDFERHVSSELHSVEQIVADTAPVTEAAATNSATAAVSSAAESAASAPQGEAPSAPAAAPPDQAATAAHAAAPKA